MPRVIGKYLVLSRISSTFVNYFLLELGSSKENREIFLLQSWFFAKNFEGNNFYSRVFA